MPLPPACCTTTSVIFATVSVRAQSRCHSDATASHVIMFAPAAIMRWMAGTAVAQGRRELAGGQRQVDDVLAVPVQDGGDATGPAGATGAALAELGADLGFEAEVSHGDVLLKRWIGSARRRPGAAHP